MEVKSLVIFVSLVVLISVRSSDGIKCWVCTSAIEPKCRDPLNNGLTSTECGGNDQCSTVKTGDVVERACQNVEMKNGCNKDEALGAETCICTGNECNSATMPNTAIMPKLSLFGIGLGILVKIIF